MPIPTSITDLNPVAALNSPAGSDSPTEGDNYIRALSAIVRQFYDGTTPGAFPTLTQLADTTNASNADALVGVKRTFSGSVGNTLHNRIEADELNLKADLVCAADGVTSDSAKFSTAILSGVERMYVPKGDYALATVLSHTLLNDLEIYGEGRFVYTGAATTENLLTIQCNGFSFRLRGVTFDGGDLAPGGIRIENQVAMNPLTDPEVVIADTKITNFRMTVPSIWNNAAYVAGSFRRSVIEGNDVSNITRAAGTGSPGVNGTTGIYVTFDNTARYVRECIHTGNRYYNITGGDASGSSNNVDYDAFKYYAPSPLSNPNSDSTVYGYSTGTLVSHDNFYHNCRGRALKVQALATVYSEKILRDGDYICQPGSSVEINLQYGCGSVRDIQFFYKDYLVSSTVTSPIQNSGLSLVGFFQGAWYNEESAGVIVSGLQIHNAIKTGVGSNIQAILGVTTGGTPQSKDRPLVSLSDVVMNRGQVDWIVTQSWTTGYGEVHLNNITVPKLTYSAIGTGDNNTNVQIQAFGVVNMDGVKTPANALPFITNLSGGDHSYFGMVSGALNRGFLQNFNNGADFRQAPSMNGAALSDPYGRFGGMMSVQSMQLATEQVGAFDRRFFTSGVGMILVSCNIGAGGQGLYAIGGGQVATIFAGSLISNSTTGLNLDTAGRLNLWFSGGVLNVKNRIAAGPHYVTVTFLG